MIQVRPAASPSEIAIARDLFREYEAAGRQDPAFAGYVDARVYGAEVASLPGLYAPPAGALLLAWAGDRPAGCVACRPLATPLVCEMKRLFVRPEHRGQRIGEHLVRALLLAAREMGYERMRLDTLPSMRVAQELYTELGFYPIPAYNDNPIPSARFLEVRLGAQDC